MLIPSFWAEAKARAHEHGRSFTVRRFGYSETSQADAVAVAEHRAAEALARVVAGDHLPRRERKQAYPDGDLPIREEVVERHGDVVITRNAYGARCLNVPDVLFADIDFDDVDEATSSWLTVIALAGAAVAFVTCTLLDAPGWLYVLSIVGVVVVSPLVAHMRSARVEDPEERAMRRVQALCDASPGAHLRVYRTPAGLRVLAMHRTFDAAEPEVARIFAALEVDPRYARMCARQRCFRARISPKPWRIGERALSRVTRAVWPVPQATRSRRDVWIARYEARAQDFAACAFVRAFGSGATCPEAEAVMRRHDDTCRVGRDLPLA